MTASILFHKLNFSFFQCCMVLVDSSWVNIFLCTAVQKKVKKVTVLFMCKFWGTVSVHLILMEFDDIFYEIRSLIEIKVIQKIFKFITLSFKMFWCIFRFSWTLLIKVYLLQPKKVAITCFFQFFCNIWRSNDNTNRSRAIMDNIFYSKILLSFQ